MEAKKIHFIGICGVAMSALALAFKKQGWQVTGSDAGFYPPISTHLKIAGVDFYPGWHPEKLGTPDLVVVGNVASSTNPEWLYVQEKRLNFKSYPEVIAEYFVKKNSIVCAGTYGKSTSTTLLTWILKEAEFNPSYMFGGLSLNEIPAAEMTGSDWSILEGDEYKTSRWDSSPKFSHYSPSHLLLTSVIWDHADVYPTEQKYFEAFEKLVAAVPKNGLVVISEQALKVLNHPSPLLRKEGTIDLPLRRGGVPTEEGRRGPVIYGKNSANNYTYTNIVQSKNGLDFDIIHKGNTYHIASSCLGEYMADNITGSFALAHQIGISPEKIISSIAEFKGMKRRLEKRLDGAITIFDDIAHSPAKAKAVLQTLRQIYTGKIYAVFEPNTGNRRPEATPWYKNSFSSADEVIIPRLTKIKADPDEEPALEGEELAKIISETHSNARYFEEDEKLIAYLKQKTRANDVVVFLGSHGFRGMIDELVHKVCKVESL
ncbi:MAG: hypothetical protein A2754_00845 [Candidatus Magasanikbacteria bacterium RIFCSPHIGHO2_01_FULL_47_8]|uniref:UDP-N-acetylmuramate:L-alanyl-gamma-D-glutamyl-meso-diaminopimelate ligase n=1 Tax=Candidatus Magasanikbacteria bacterium RIFCSPHIGHO2_01_FULL_47_8 TaxID=1798673 RepID=A0A1F6MD16_9BACT|nr:MAG: hypothetical protein A2754_00845 [Candidatus Magasanikbacteria bacterium RIFCSPHIGHO2_01_FULL_47_8]